MTSGGATQREVERKYALDDGTDLAPALAAVLTALGPEAHLADVDRFEQVATYVDTALQDLSAARTTLRRRTGGSDDGWHLKLPGDGAARHEVHAPLGRSVRTPPVRLRRLVTALTRGAALTPVAEVRTDRTVRHVLLDGTVRAELVDDRVTATALRGGAGAQTWRELEVELVDPDAHGEDLLDAVDAALRAAGVEPAGHASKLARALGTPPAPQPRRLRRSTPAGEVVLDHVREQLTVLRTQDPLVRLDVPDSVHAARVASRRLRSALTTYGALFDADAVAPLRAGLKEFASVLGGARDAEVQRERLLDLLADAGAPGTSGAPGDDDDAAAAAEVRRLLDARHAAAHAAALAHLDSPEHAALLADLERFATDAPLERRAGKRAGEVLPRLALRAHRTLRRRVATARAAGDPRERDLAFHEARKRAKETRYALEVLEPVLGEAAADLRKAVKDVQEVLGEHQDAVVTRDLLRELAGAEGVPAAAVFAFGRLHAAEDARARAALAGFDEAWERASAKGLRKALVR